MKNRYVSGHVYLTCLDKCACLSPSFLTKAASLSLAAWVFRSDMGFIIINMLINTHSEGEEDNPFSPIANARIRSSFLQLKLKAIRDGCGGREEGRMGFSA